jgi:threonine synthase
LYVLRKSGGAATVVRNESILEWQRRLAEEEGLYVEPASAGTIAAISQLRARGDIRASDRDVALLTACGLKDPDATASIQGELPTVSGDPGSVFSQLQAAKLLPV